MDLLREEYFGTPSVLARCVYEACEPFRLGDLVTYSTYDVDFMRWSVIAEVSFLHHPTDILYGCVVTSDRDYLLDDLDAWMLKVAKDMGDVFRFRTRVDPESHIELGEN